MRLKCIPIVQYYDENYYNDNGKWITVAVDNSKIIMAVNSEKWIKNGEYWYYSDVLKGFEETDEIIIDWKVLEIPSEIKDKKIRTDVRVILEYAQASHNVWKDVFQIDELPEGVNVIE